MFNMSLPEILVILAIALIVIGPKKLPDIAKSLGKALGEFKKATSTFKESLDLNGNNYYGGPLDNADSIHKESVDNSDQSDIDAAPSPDDKPLEEKKDKAANNNEEV